MKKGFTLIELLAVIVILAIIALIALPIVLDIINDAKDSATLRSAVFYLDGLEKSIATATIKDKKIPDGEYEILKTGNVCLKYENNECKDILKIDIDGEKPNGGIVAIKKGQIDNFIISSNSKIIKKDNKGQLVFATKLKDYIKNLYSETKTTTVNGIEYSLDETHGLINDRLGSKDVIKTGGNIRYYGKEPNNYIDIGDRDSQGNIIFWRIIGLFKDIEVTDENDNVIGKEDLVKIIRADKLMLDDVIVFSWDLKYNGTERSHSNTWQTSTLNNLLNNAYYNSISTDYYRYINSTTPPSKEFYDFNSIGLSSQTHKKIEKVKWSLGADNTNKVYVNDMYRYERSGSNSWQGKVALMYPSDYGYSVDLSSCNSTLINYDTAETCKISWMYDSEKYQWALIPYSKNTHQSFYISSAGKINYESQVCVGYSVRPVLYLKSNVVVVEEKETDKGIKYLVVDFFK